MGVSLLVACGAANRPWSTARIEDSSIRATTDDLLAAIAAFYEDGLLERLRTAGCTEEASYRRTVGQRPVTEVASSDENDIIGSLLAQDNAPPRKRPCEDVYARADALRSLYETLVTAGAFEALDIVDAFLLAHAPRRESDNAPPSDCTPAADAPVRAEAAAVLHRIRWHPAPLGYASALPQAHCIQLPTLSGVRSLRSTESVVGVEAHALNVDPSDPPGTTAAMWVPHFYSPGSDGCMTSNDSRVVWAQGRWHVTHDSVVGPDFPTRFSIRTEPMQE